MMAGAVVVEAVVAERLDAPRVKANGVDVFGRVLGARLGIPPDLRPLGDVAKDMQKSLQREAKMYEQLSDFNESAKHVSAANLIK